MPRRFLRARSSSLNESGRSKFGNASILADHIEEVSRSSPSQGLLRLAGGGECPGPGIEHRHVCLDEIADISAHHDQLLNQSSGGDEYVRLAVGMPAPATSLHDLSPTQHDVLGDRHDPALEQWPQGMRQPSAEIGSSLRISRSRSMPKRISAKVTVLTNRRAVGWAATNARTCEFGWGRRSSERTLVSSSHPSHSFTSRTGGRSFGSSKSSSRTRGSAMARTRSAPVPG